MKSYAITDEIIMSEAIKNKSNDVSPITRETSAKEMLAFASVSIVLTLGAFMAIKHLRPNPNNQSAKSGTNYVFFSTEGKAMVFSEQDVFGIVQMYEDGVMPSVIASKYNVNAVMVCRIVNSFNSKN